MKEPHRGNPNPPRPQAGGRRRKHIPVRKKVRRARRTDKDGTDTTIAVVNQRTDCDQFTLLAQTLEEAGLWRCLDLRRKAVRKKASSFKVVIKPDLEMFDVMSPTGTDPRLVEHLISLLYERGYKNVSVVDGISSSDLWLDNREVSILADLAGYRFQTEGGDKYSVVNLSEGAVDGGFGHDSILAHTPLGPSWIGADFRISFAKNKTDLEYTYSLGLRNVLGVLPLRDKEYHYCHRFDPADVCLELLRRTPVHFAVIDAVLSNHGSDGTSKINPIKTDTIIAGENLLLCDFAGALKMGLDPYASALNAGVLRRTGFAQKYEIRGDLAVYRGWANVPKLLSDSVQRRNKSPIAHRMGTSWLQTVNSEIFPFRNGFDERINNAAVKLFCGADGHPLRISAAVGLNYLIAFLSNAVQAYALMYDKERVARRHTSLGYDASQYALSDIEAICSYMEPIARLVAQTSPDRNGLRWRYLDRSVVFEFKKTLPIPFGKFSARVDITSAVRMLNDNIGGALSVLSRDKKGRVTHQAERNIYLPQPNWMAVFGGDVIDVGKLEFIRYEKDIQQIFWKAVTSANNSALADDGIITFRSSRKQGTEITIVARQEFALPLFWQVFNIDYLPRIKDGIVSDTYVSYFSRTMANYEAAFEGRDTRLGRDWDRTKGEQESERPWTPLEEAANALLKFLEIAQPVIRALRQNDLSSSKGASGDKSATKEIFNFIGHAAGTFLKDLLEAAGKDLASMGRAPWEESR